MNAKYPDLPRRLSSVLRTAYKRAVKARDGVLHRLGSLPRQQAIVQDWKDRPTSMANLKLPWADHVRDAAAIEEFRLNEIRTLERYEDELPQRLQEYADALRAIESAKAEVLAALERNPPSKGAKEPWPLVPWELSNPWPDSWPPMPESEEEESEVLECSVVLPASVGRPPRSAEPTAFEIRVDGCNVALEARFPDGIEAFKESVCAFLDGQASSRWPATVEAMRCGIRWAQLDRYLSECSSPWLPRDFIDEEFGLRGRIGKRNELADLFGRCSAAAGRFYLAHQPGRYRTSRFRLEDWTPSMLRELLDVGLIRWGGEQGLADLVPEVPFQEWKSVFTLSDLPMPRGFEDTREALPGLIERRGESWVRAWMRRFVDASEVVEILEPKAWDREERLGIRARANVLVSTLVVMGEGDEGVDQILRWA